MLRTNRLFGMAALSLLLAATACHDDELFRPSNALFVDPLFTRYVSMGNSITAGFQSGGIYDTIQAQAYPVLLARAMGTPSFISPLMSAPGCPAPYTNVFTQTRRPGPACALRKAQATPTPLINNVAVPGAEVMDAIANTDTASNSNALTTFFLGGLTQTQMMARVHPTFVSVWIGNNDVLGAATNTTNAGDTTKVTSVAAFQTRYGMMLDSIDNVGPDGGILIGVANVTAIPFFSTGTTYFGAKLANQLPLLMTVSANCAPPRGDSVLVPFPYGGALLAAASAGAARNLDCGDTVAVIVVPSEFAKMKNTVAAYNTYISGQAAARGWAFYDPNAALDSLRTQVVGAVRPLPAFGTACTTNPFGTAFSCDGVHPSASTHKLIANKLRQAINAAPPAGYGTSIPAIP